MSDFFTLPERPSGARFEVRPAPRTEWMGPQRTAIPAVLPAERLIARTDEVVISLGCFWVYPAGLEIEVSVDTKDEWSELDPFQFGRPPRPDDGDELSPEQLRLGFRFANGAKVTSVGAGSAWPEEPGPKSPVFSSRGGRGSGGRSEADFWLWPLPPLGPLLFVCEWPVAGIPLTESELDAAAILDAAGRARTIFADDGESAR